MRILRFIVGMTFVIYGTRGLIDNVLGDDSRPKLSFVLIDYLVAYLIMGPR